jgi:hypothetical protein
MKKVVGVVEEDDDDTGWKMRFLSILTKFNLFGLYIYIYAFLDIIIYFHSSIDIIERCLRIISRQIFQCLNVVPSLTRSFNHDISFKQNTNSFFARFLVLLSQF